MSDENSLRSWGAAFYTEERANAVDLVRVSLASSKQVRSCRGVSNVGGGMGGWTDDHENKLRSPGAVRALERLGSELKFDVAQTCFFLHLSALLPRVWFRCCASFLLNTSRYVCSSRHPEFVGRRITFFLGAPEEPLDSLQFGQLISTAIPTKITGQAFGSMVFNLAKQPVLLGLRRRERVGQGGTSIKEQNAQINTQSYSWHRVERMLNEKKKK